MPKKLTAHTGMDALTHAIEAYVSTVAQPFTDPLAMEAIKIIDKDLQASYDGDMKARENMHYAQCMAGMAFSNALLGITHSMAHKTGAAFETGHIPHGCANAIYLPYVIQYNAVNKRAKARYCEIAKMLGLKGKSGTALVNALCDRIREMNAYFGIPASLKDYGINEQEFLAKIDGIAKLAVGDACTGANPRPITPAKMKALFTHVYYGTTVNV